MRRSAASRSGLVKIKIWSGSTCRIVVTPSKILLYQQGHFQSCVTSADMSITSTDFTWDPAVLLVTQVFSFQGGCQRGQGAGGRLRAEPRKVGLHPGRGNVRHEGHLSRFEHPHFLVSTVAGVKAEVPTIPEKLWFEYQLLPVRFNRAMSFLLIFHF